MIVRQRTKRGITLSTRAFILLILLGYSIPSNAFPPPEVFALIGGGIMSPILVVMGGVSLLLKYLSVKTKVYSFWLLHLPKIFLAAVLFLLLVNPQFTSWFAFKNNPIDAQTIRTWQESGEQPILVDILAPYLYSNYSPLYATACRTGVN
ncbi:MAG: hypothetical protein ACRCXC_12010 [Legionella sp.]